MEANDYRLERWLAILLSLLFFLPFVAKADEILTPDVYASGNPYRDGDTYLAIGRNALVPVKIRVEREDDDQEVLVEAAGFEGRWLVRGKNLHAGPIAVSKPESLELQANANNAPLVLGGATYELSYRCAVRQCTLVLTSGGVSQDLATVTAEHRFEIDHSVLFAGDLDRDGRLDLIGNFAGPHDWLPTMWLSSAARKGQLVGQTAKLVGVVDHCC